MNFTKLLFKGLNNYEKFQPFSKLGLQGLHLNPRQHAGVHAHVYVCVCWTLCVSACVCERERERDSYCFIKQLKDKDWHIMKY